VAALQRTNIRLGLPSKGRMSEDTMQLLADCQLNVKKPNPRQYLGNMSNMPQVEVWFQRATDVVRKMVTRDIDIGIVGYDMLEEIAGDQMSDLVVIHDELRFGACHLALAVPTFGDFAEVNSVDELKTMTWTEERPLRVITGYTSLAQRFFTAENGFPHAVILTADGALEAAPAMGTADMILDLVSTGTTLRENNLKQIEGGKLLMSEGCLVANRKAVAERPEVLAVAKEILERLEAHLRAQTQYEVTANIRATSKAECAQAIFDKTGHAGLQGPTINDVYTRGGEKYVAATVMVPSQELYPAIKELRAIGGSGIIVKPVTYIFDEEPLRWRKLLEELNIEAYSESDSD
jgi:ATP phosphoribosyltransferase